MSFYVYKLLTINMLNVNKDQLSNVHVVDISDPLIPEFIDTMSGGRTILVSEDHTYNLGAGSFMANWFGIYNISEQYQRKKISGNG